MSSGRKANKLETLRKLAQENLQILISVVKNFHKKISIHKIIFYIPILHFSLLVIFFMYLYTWDIGNYPYAC